MTDVNNVPKLLKVLDELDRHIVQIGVFGEDDSEMLMIARVHEFGVNIQVTDKMRGYLHHIGIHLRKDTQEIRIPERSYIRGYFDNKQSEMISQAERLLEQVIRLRTKPMTFFEALGEYIVGEVRKYMVDLKVPANSQVTIDRKGSSNPLIDTGRLLDSITYKVVRA